MTSVLKLALVLVLLSTTGFGCAEEYTYQSDYGQETVKVEEAEEPVNPYRPGSGHYAGFEWAADTGRTCGGNSQSFIEGCEEYYGQINDIENN